MNGANCLLPIFHQFTCWSFINATKPLYYCCMCYFSEDLWDIAFLLSLWSSLFIYSLSVTESKLRWVSKRTCSFLVVLSYEIFYALKPSKPKIETWVMAWMREQQQKYISRVELNAEINKHTKNKNKLIMSLHIKWDIYPHCTVFLCKCWQFLCSAVKVVVSYFRFPSDTASFCC